MNTNEFKSWLEGFIEGRDTLSEIQLKIVREKLSQVVSVSSISTFPVVVPNTGNPYWTSNPDWTYDPHRPGQPWYTTTSQTTTNDKLENNDK